MQLGSQEMKYSFFDNTKNTRTLDISNFGFIFLQACNSFVGGSKKTTGFPLE